MSEGDEDHDKHKSKDVFSSLISTGGWLCRKGEYKKAVDSFTTALTLKPGDRNCLVGRAKCYLKNGLPEKSLEDAETSLKEDKTFVEGLYQKAEALYYMGEFEFALVFYHRGQAIRPKMQEFRLGIQKAHEAIETAIGCPSSVQLEVKGDLSFLQKEEVSAQPVIDVKDLMKEKAQQSKKIPKNEKITKKLYGEFYDDKKLLETLLKDEVLAKSKLKSGEQVQHIIETCLTHLDNSADFWSQEKPTSAYDRGCKLSQKNSSNLLPGATSKPAEFVQKSLNDIDAELTSGNAEGCLKKAKKVMKTVNGWSEREVPNKKEVLCCLHGYMGSAFYNLGDLDKALNHHQKDLELAKQCKCSEAKSRALENIGKVYALMGEFKQAIKFWEKKIPLVRDDLERTWLVHELGRCYLELNCYKEARDCGFSSLARAEDVADDKWQRNASVLLAQSEMKLGNVEACVANYKRALKHDKRLEEDSLEDAIQKALDEAEQLLLQ